VSNLSSPYEIEIWADSFHEGEWILENFKDYFTLKEKLYLHGFIPRYIFELTDGFEVSFTVYGSYKTWSPLHKKIKDLLEFGKPDIIIFDPQKNKIIIAIEETAAVPTGNQALQRCERIFGSALSGVPFAYLLGEFGVHKDGNVRRTSIWPTMLALKLSLMYRVPSLTFHYSDIKNPEDYSAGSGVKELFDYLSLKINLYFGIDEKDTTAKLVDLTTKIVGSMCEFILSQVDNIAPYLPNKTELSKKRYILVARFQEPSAF
jgi:hypothetical protein